MRSIILHIDFDSFFASCEQQFRPQLRGKPIGVTAHNGRTAIIAASREAKKLGIKNVMRSYEAFKICPNLQLVRADFTKYWEISKTFITICKDYSPQVEVFSLDELFMDITHSAHLFGGTDDVVRRIKNRISREIGEYITVSVGISHNKLLAKLASGLKKPNGVMKIEEKDVEEVYRNAKLTDICGIGERIERRLNMMGIYKLLQLQRTPVGFLIAEFGDVEGHHLADIGRGIDRSVVVPYTDAPDVKSVGRNYCLPHNEYDYRIVLQNIYELCEEIGIKLRRLKKKARTVGIYMRGTYEVFGRKTYSLYMNRGQDIFTGAMQSLQGLPDRGYVRQIGVWVGNLVDANTVPQSLLSPKNQEKLQEAIDGINDKFGHHTIRNGFLLYADKLTTVPNGFGADRYERKILAEDGRGYFV